MKRAGRVHGRRLIAVFAALCLVAVEVVAYNDYTLTQGLLSSLSNADVERLPTVLDQLSIYPHWFYASRARQLAAQPGIDDRARLGYSLALLPGDPSQVGYLHDRLLEADASEMAVIRDALARHRGELLGILWNDLRSAKPDQASVLPVAGTLVQYDPASPSWTDVGDIVASAMVKAKLDDARAWREALAPARELLMHPLARIYRDKGPEVERKLATDLLAHYAADKPKFLVDLLLDADSESFPVLLAAIRRDDPIVLSELRNAIKPAANADAVAGMRARARAGSDKQLKEDVTELAMDDNAARCTGPRWPSCDSVMRMRCGTCSNINPTRGAAALS